MFTAGHDTFLRVPSGKQLVFRKRFQGPAFGKSRLLHSGKASDEFFAGRVQRLLRVPFQRGGDADRGEQHVAQLLVDVGVIPHGLAQLAGLFC